MSVKPFFIPGEKSPEISPEHEAKLQPIIAELTPFPDLSVERCGSWLWVTGNTYHHRQRLTKLGFKFQSDKRAWAYHVTPFRYYPSQKPLTLSRIRNLYGCVMYS